MRVYVLEHAPFEKLGAIETWAKSRNFQLETASSYRGDLLKSATEFDLLIIMGGPQSASDTKQFPYLKSEITLIQTTIQAGKRVLGICLGAQLISEAMGSKTLRSPHKEVGVFPVSLNEKGRQDPLFTGFPPLFPATHWHDDMSGLPEEAMVLAESEGCPRQIIKFQRRVYGFQCHMEITSESIEEMIKNCPSDLVPGLVPGKFIQSAEELRQQSYSEINSLMETMLDRFILI